MKFVLKNQTDEEAPIEFRLILDHDNDVVLQAKKQGETRWIPIIDISNRTGKLNRYSGSGIKELGFNTTPNGFIEVKN